MIAGERAVSHRFPTADGPPADSDLLRLALDTAGMGVWQADFRNGTVRLDARLKSLFGLAKTIGGL